MLYKTWKPKCMFSKNGQFTCAFCIMHKIIGVMTQTHIIFTICSHYMSWETYLAPLASQLFQAWLLFAYRLHFEYTQSSFFPSLKEHHWQNHHLFADSAFVFETFRSARLSNFSKCGGQIGLTPCNQDCSLI